MGLPNIYQRKLTTSINNEYRIPVSADVVEKVNKYKNMAIYNPDTLPYPNRSFINSISQFRLSNNYMVFTNGILDDNDTYTYVDPNAVFILPRYMENVPYASNWIRNAGFYGSDYAFERKVENVEVSAPGLFYYQYYSGTYQGGAIAVDKDTREILSYAVTPHIRMIESAKRTYKDGSTYSDNNTGTYSVASAIYGLANHFTTHSNLNLANDWQNTIYQFGNSIGNSLLRTTYPYSEWNWCYYGNLTFSNAPQQLNTPNYGYEGDGRRFTTNASKAFYSCFKNIIFVDSAEDYDSLFTMSHDDFLGRIESGDDVSEITDNITPPYDPGGTSTGGGGGGSFFQPEPVETILPDGSSELDSSNAGVFTRYLVSPNQLKLFGDWLWTDDIIQAFLKEIMNIVYGKSSDAVISLMSYPFSMSGIGLSITGSNLWFGNMDSGVISSGKLTKEFASIDWGTIFLDGYWNNFLDYAPHTTINLYLPWLGFVPIDPHECLPGSLTVKTNIELGRGTAVHNVIGNGGVCIGQYSTVCGKQLPITALDTGGKLTSMVVSAVAAGVSAGAAGGAKSAGIAAANSWQATAARYTAPSWEAGNRAVEAIAARAEAPYRRIQTSANRVAAASAVASLRPPQIHQRSGSSTGNSAGLGCQYPYVIIGRPTQSVPEQYGSHFGYPSNIYAILGTLKGYTEISSIHLDGFACTTEERSEIDELLKGGVIF